MTSPKYNGPGVSRRDSAAIQASSLGGNHVGMMSQAAGYYDPGGAYAQADRLNRPSLDNMGGASGSRRPSANSIQSSHHSHSTSPHLAHQPPLSPASVSSSSTYPWMTPREHGDMGSSGAGQLSTSPQAGLAQLPQHQQLPSPMDHPRKHYNLPRIATPSDRSGRSPSTDDMMEDGGPRSAPPVSSPLAGPALPFAAHPLRSASDPSRTGDQGSGRSSPMTSPTGGPDPQMVHYKSRSQDGSGLPPPRGSSFTNMAAAMEHQARRSETPTSTTSSQQATPLQIQQQPPPNPKRSGSTTCCAKCGNTVHGQFVRALHQVYHLDCFRCKVSHPAAVTC
jgi:hypothetical protein